jgi:hypothetical protein
MNCIEKKKKKTCSSCSLRWKVGRVGEGWKERMSWYIYTERVNEPLSILLEPVNADKNVCLMNSEYEQRINHPM